MSDKIPETGFKFSHMGIGSVFKQHRLKVPSFQREYAWDSEQVEQLYNDLSGAKTENKDYFLGTIVTISKGGASPLEIVDGQQRLTTTAIYLAAIRDCLRGIDGAEIVVTGLETDFLITIDRTARKKVPKLELNLDDNEFFSRLIESEPSGKVLAPTRQSHHLLAAAAKIAKQRVKAFASNFSAQDVADRLNDWLHYIEFNAPVILLEAPNGAQAFKMFETLNDRGLRTSQADLVKSYLFGQSSNRISEAQAKWSSMRDNLEEIDDEDSALNFLRHALIATKRFVRSDEVYDVTQKLVRGDTNAITFLSDLERLSRVYVATYRADSDHWSDHPAKTTNALKAFNRFDIKPIRPLLLAIALKFSNKLSGEALQLLVSVTVRLLIASSTRSGTNEQTFAAAALGVFNEEIKTVKSLKDALANVTVSDADFRESFAIAKSSKPELARYYLRALEAATANEAEPWYVENSDQTKINLEHVLPKKRKAGTWNEFDLAPNFYPALSSL